MTHAELRTLIHNLQDCDDYLAGRSSSKHVQELAAHAAKKAVLERKGNLIDRLREAGLQIDDEV